MIPCGEDVALVVCHSVDGHVHHLVVGGVEEIGVGVKITVSCSQREVVGGVSQCDVGSKGLRIVHIHISAHLTEHLAILLAIYVGSFRIRNGYEGYHVAQLVVISCRRDIPMSDGIFRI